jgi:hypothetical protein
VATYGTVKVAGVTAAAGVTATSPATSPDEKPSIVGRFRCAHSANTQDIAAVAAATCVFTSASAAS